MSLPSPPDAGAVRAAAFLAQVLGLADDPVLLAEGLAQIRDEAPTTVYSTELASTVGPAAFLVYAYDLVGDPAGDGGTVDGRARYDADLTTLQEAAARDSPGPRLLASAQTESEGFLLATTPATFRAMTGAAAEAATEPVATDGDATPSRREAAGALLDLLRAADAQASAWLAAVRSEGGDPTADDPAGDALAFDDVETELALFLLDERGIRSLLQAVNTVITAARRQAEGRPGPDAVEKSDR
ncbi:MAG: hypothetical protein AVDCRST_MAG49-3838 [uncultured Thermomicrobiales bacterium]|uniref:Uncharacterized protein n=1 Tax=uncultured Thermomicrobiales bacterium TaxID=1645740 RepID=A0A6J4V9Q2_9BACT|nr:MAG: hypothetical protein AVDCRST_MAG49-3838 [uncultured Thermomicrobiales bacterium]